MQVSAERASALLQDNPPAIAASFRQLSDLFLLSEGGYHPVERFLPGNEVSHVCENMHLTTGEPWSIPVIFPVSEEQANALKDAERVILTDGGKAAGVLRIEEVFKIDKSHYSKHIFRTEDPAHPGVQWLAEAGDYSLAGEVETFPDWQFDIPGGLPFSPGEVRAKIAELGWKKGHRLPDQESHPSRSRVCHQDSAGNRRRPGRSPLAGRDQSRRYTRRSPARLL